MEMPFGPHGMMPGDLHQPFPGQMRSMRPGMGMGMGMPQPGMRPPHMMTPSHYAVPHRQMPPYSEVPRPEVKILSYADWHILMMSRHIRLTRDFVFGDRWSEFCTGIILFFVLNL